MSLRSIKIECAETGSCFNVRLENSNEPSLTKFKSQIGLFVSIPPEDQILLIGPPFKRLDSQFGPDIQSDGQRIFLYNRKVFSEEACVPLETRLKPYDILTPVAIGAPPVEIAILLEDSNSPLLKALPGYERHFLTNLKKGESFLFTSEQVLQSCRAAIDEMMVQSDSVDAALNNLQDHYASTKVAFEFSQDKLVLQQTKHKLLLDSFENDLDKLASLYLHSSFVTQTNILNIQSVLPNLASSSGAPNNSSNGSGGSGGSNKETHLVKLKSLLDCLPVDKERQWYRQCGDVHKRVDNNLEQLKLVFEQVSKGLHDVVVPTIVVNELKLTLKVIEDNLRKQQDFMIILRDDYRYVFETLTNLKEDEKNIVELLTDLEKRSKNQVAVILNPMSELCNETLKSKKLIEISKTELTATLYKSMKCIATVQTDIQYKLKKGLELMKKWHKGHNEYFYHLEHVGKLPNAYESLLNEIVRRNAYTNIFEKKIEVITNSLAAFRAEETSRREEFIRTQGLFLPPIFFQLIPSLKDKPPYFTSSLTESQWLPNITMDDVEKFRFSYNSDDGSSDSVSIGELSMESRDDNNRDSNEINKDNVNIGDINKNDDGNYDNNASESDLKSLSLSSIPNISLESSLNNNIPPLPVPNANIRLRSLSTNYTVLPNVSASIDNTNQDNQNNNNCQGSIIFEAVNDKNTSQQQDPYVRCLELEYQNSILMNKITDMSRQIALLSASQVKEINATNTNTNTSITENQVDANIEIKTNVIKDDIIVPQGICTNNDSNEGKTRPRSNSSFSSVKSNEDSVMLKAFINEIMGGYIMINELLNFEEIDIRKQLEVNPLIRQGSLIEKLNNIVIIEDDNEDNCINNIKIAIKNDSLDLNINEYINNTINNTLDKVYRMKYKFMNKNNSFSKYIHNLKDLLSEQEDIVLDYNEKKLSFNDLKISFRNYNVGDVALFMPATLGMDVYVAFHYRCPHRYLARESLEELRSQFVKKSGDKAEYVIGRIICIETKIASKDENPFKLMEGIEYHTLYAEAISLSSNSVNESKSSRKSSPNSSNNSLNLGLGSP